LMDRVTGLFGFTPQGVLDSINPGEILRYRKFADTTPRSLKRGMNQVLEGLVS